MEWHIIEKLKTKKVKILIKNTSHQILSNSKHRKPLFFCEVIIIDLLNRAFHLH